MIAVYLTIKCNCCIKTHEQVVTQENQKMLVGFLADFPMLQLKLYNKIYYTTPVLFSIIQYTNAGVDHKTVPQKC